MYDCQYDHYTGFALNTTNLPGSRSQCPTHLQGELTAQALSQTARATLEALHTFCQERGYQPQLAENSLALSGVSFEDTLTINARFGDSLVISAHLRRDKPVSVR